MSHNKHRNDNNSIFGQPEIEKLYNGRYRMTFRCLRDDNNTGWYYDNAADIFANFGTLSDAPYAKQGKGVTAPANSTWPDMKLIRHGWEFVPQQPVPFLTFVYETLTSSYVQDRQEDVDFDLNGLRRVTRTLVATEGTAYGKVVGTDTIQHTALEYGEETLYLASVTDEKLPDDEAGYTRIIETWIEPGTLSVSTKNVSEGVREVSTTFLVTEGATVGPVVDRSTSNFAGLKTISVTTLQDKDGNSIIQGGERLVNQYQRMVDFTYPGVVSLRQDVITSNVGIDPNILNFEIDAPVQSKVQATVSVIFQSSASIVAGDFVYDDGGGAASGYWNPTEWAKTYASGIGWDYSPFSTSQALRGYRTNNSVSGITKFKPTGSNSFTTNGVTVFQSAGTSYLNTVSEPNLARVNGVSDSGGVLFMVDGKRIYGATPFILQVSGGPEDPSGNKYTLDVDVRPAFEDVDGNQYYKKTIVTATV